MRYILRCGSVRFSDIIVNPNVRFSFVINPTVRFGAVFQNRESYCAVRCSFRKSKILRSGSVRFPVEPIFLRCGSNPGRENRTTHAFLCGAPYIYINRTKPRFRRVLKLLSGHHNETAVSLRCTELINRTKGRFPTVSDVISRGST